MSEISKGNPLDKNHSGKVKIKTTNYPMHYHTYGTYRFGENGVIGVFNGLAKDKTKIRQIINLNTYTLKAPLLTPITMNRTYIQVPRMAILPNAWDKLFVNPKIGNDIDATEYGTSIKPTSFEDFLKNLVQILISNITVNIDDEDIYQGTSADFVADLQNIIKQLAFCELVYSHGSLVNSMGAHIANLWPDKKRKTFDQYFENFWKIFLPTTLNIGGFMATIDNINYKVNISLDNPEKGTSFTLMTLNQFLEKIRDNTNFSIAILYQKNGNAWLFPLIESELKTLGQALLSLQENLDISLIQFNKPFDLAPLWAYQLACAEFFTKDNVDYIYNAELFRQYIGSIITDTLIEGGEHIDEYMYNYNGQKIVPDWLCAKWFTLLTQDYQPEAESYFFALFKYNRSLKYNDYFTGARTRPIAIGDTDINVTVDDTVEIIDVVRNIQKQRFLNVVNKIPRDLKGYTKGIFGKDIAPDWHNPLFLMTVSESIYGEETENTGAAQLTEKQTRTSVLKNEANRLEVNFNLDRNSIIVGIVNFDIPRAYSKGIKRYFFDVDRFDWFNPYLQYTGDQPVFMEEIDCRTTGTFGYQGAYMDKKQEYNEAFGGFIEDLKGWTFLDRYIGYENDNNPNIVIGPDFIRSKPSELDRFYISLSGHSMANYYHFIMDVETHTNAQRAMAYNPQILG